MQQILIPAALIAFAIASSSANATLAPLGESVRTLVAEQTANPLAGKAAPNALPPTDGAHTDKAVTGYQQKKPANSKAVVARGALALGSRR